MKRNHLKKAILLGLIAASIHAPVWAEDFSELWNPNDHQDEIVGEDLTITNTAGGGIGYTSGTVTVKPDDAGNGGDLSVTASSNGIDSQDATAPIKILANNVTITSTGTNGIFTGVGGDKNGVVIGSSPTEENPNAEDRPVNSLTINAHGQGIDNKHGNVAIYGSTDSTITICSEGYNGEESEDQSAINAGRNKNNTITDSTTTIEGGTITLSSNGGSGTLTRTEDSSTTIIAHDSISISSNHLHPENSDPDSGIYVYKTIENAGINNMAGATTVTTGTGLSITSSQSSILAQSGTVDVTSNGGKNVIQAALETVDAAAAIDAADQDDSEGTADPQEPRQYGTKHAIKAAGGAQVKVAALNGNNELYGVIYAKNEGTDVTVEANSAKNVTEKGSGSNYIYSAAHGSTDEVGNREKVVAALYAQDKGQITITAGEGGINYIETYYPELEAAEAARDETGETEDPGSERTIWAQRGGQIDITGTTIIRSSNAENFTRTVMRRTAAASPSPQAVKK